MPIYLPNLAYLPPENLRFSIDNVYSPSKPESKYYAWLIRIRISKSIIEDHGGKIWAKNNNGQGKSGATFCFSLPTSSHMT